MLYRRCYQKAVKEFPEYFAGLQDISAYSSDTSMRACNLLELNGVSVCHELIYDLFTCLKNMIGNFLYDIALTSFL